MIACKHFVRSRVLVVCQRKKQSTKNWSSDTVMSSVGYCRLFIPAPSSNGGGDDRIVAAVDGEAELSDEFDAAFVGTVYLEVICDRQAWQRPKKTSNRYEWNRDTQPLLIVMSDRSGAMRLWSCCGSDRDNWKEDVCQALNDAHHIVTFNTDSTFSALRHYFPREEFTILWRLKTWGLFQAVRSTTKQWVSFRNLVKYNQHKHALLEAQFPSIYAISTMVQANADSLSPDSTTKNACIRLAEVIRCLHGLCRQGTSLNVPIMKKRELVDVTSVVLC